MPDYTKGMIYMLEPSIDYDEGDIYYGSTTQPLYKRFFEHKKSFRYNRKYKSKMIFEKYGVENVKIILIKNYSCLNKQELEAEEAKYIRENKCVNACIPGRSYTEWRETNKERLQEKNKIYNENNKEKIKKDKKLYYEMKKDRFKEKSKIYRELNQEKIKELNKEWCEENKEELKEKKKEYYETNKVFINIKAKQYREKNREILNEKNKIKIKCECGCEVVKSYFKIHQTSKKHIDLMKSI
jgi:hypothetical protein